MGLAAVVDVVEDILGCRDKGNIRALYREAPMQNS